jgi:hypothetical protein
MSRDSANNGRTATDMPITVIFWIHPLRRNSLEYQLQLLSVRGAYSRHEISVTCSTVSGATDSTDS